jgi:hypothetical protein
LQLKRKNRKRKGLLRRSNGKKRKRGYKAYLGKRLSRVRL